MLDALTYSSSHLCPWVQAGTYYSAGKNLVPERQKVYQVGLARPVLPVVVSHRVYSL
jgi:hypothetical protein